MVGLYSHDGGQVTASAVTIKHITLSGVAGCGGGFGAAAFSGGGIVLDQFSIGDIALCGVTVGAGGAIDLSNGVIAETPVGACVQEPGYDTERLHHDVRFVNVDIPLQATSYSLPETL